MTGELLTNKLLIRPLDLSDADLFYGLGLLTGKSKPWIFVS